MRTLGGSDVPASRHLVIRGGLVAGCVVLSACSSTATSSPTSLPAIATASSTPSPTTTSSTTSSTTSTIASSTTSSTTLPTTTSTSTSTSTTGTTSTTSTTSTTTTSTIPITVPAVPLIPAVPPIPAIDALSFPVNTEIEIGRSVEGRPITVVRRGASGGTRVLVVGVIHGNEAAGVAVADRLLTEPVPAGVELFIVRSMNPDGQARQDRQNANAVDLNRNFPENWGFLGEPGDWQYGGPGPASEPETQAMVALGNSVRPDLILWYHQDLFRIAPGTGRSGEIRTRYATLAGLPIVDITGGTYTGTASQWSRTVIPAEGVGITVELGPTLSEAEVGAHVAAVFAIATEYW